MPGFWDDNKGLCWMDWLRRVRERLIAFIYNFGRFMGRRVWFPWGGWFRKRVWEFCKILIGKVLKAILQSIKLPFYDIAYINFILFGWIGKISNNIDISIK